MQHTITITTFKNIKDIQGIKISVPPITLFSGLIDATFESERKIDLPLWSPTSFDGTRCGSNALSISCLVYDVDDGESDLDTWKIFGERFTCGFHVSKSHTADHPKYRIILPLRAPIPSDDWSRASQAALQIWDQAVGKGQPDIKALKDRARAYFRASPPLDGGDYIGEWTYDAKPLIWLDYSHIPKPKPKPKWIPPKGPLYASEAFKIPAVREATCLQLGGKISGEYAKYVQCPRCGKRSVFWKIDSVGRPKCNHVNNCGWIGTFDDLTGG